MGNCSSIEIIQFELIPPYDTTVYTDYIFHTFEKQKIGKVVKIEYKLLKGSNDNWRIKSRTIVYIHIQWYDNIISLNIKRYLNKKGFANIVHNDPDTWVIQYYSEALTSYDKKYQYEQKQKQKQEPESDYYDSDYETSCIMTKQEKEFCTICNKNVLNKIHSKDCPYCILCKKYGHCAYIGQCKYCDFCKLYGHNFNDCLIYKEYIQYIGKRMIRLVFGPLYNPYFHMYLKDYYSEKDGYEFVASLIPVYNSIQQKRAELNELLIKTPLIKISNLLFLLDKLSSKNMSYASVLHNNDLLLLIKSFM